MSMDAIGSAGVYQTYSLFANRKQRTQELKSLTGTGQASDRSDAQKTFAALQQRLHGSTPSTESVMPSASRTFQVMA